MKQIELMPMQIMSRDVCCHRATIYFRRICVSLLQCSFPLSRMSTLCEQRIMPTKWKCKCAKKKQTMARELFVREVSKPKYAERATRIDVPWAKLKKSAANNDHKHQRIDVILARFVHSDTFKVRLCVCVWMICGATAKIPTQLQREKWIPASVLAITICYQQLHMLYSAVHHPCAKWFKRCCSALYSTFQYPKRKKKHVAILFITGHWVFAVAI